MPVLEKDAYKAELDATIAVNLNDPIYQGCWEELVVKVCGRVFFSKLSAELYLVDVRVAEVSVGWQREGNIIRASIEFSTANVGIWKLVETTLTAEHHLDTNSGHVRFAAKLYKLEGFLPDYKLKKEWIDHPIATW